MLAQWIGDTISKMHQFRITAKQLAEHIGWNPKYLSTVLNGHKAPKKAEEKIRKGLDELIAIAESKAKDAI